MATLAVKTALVLGLVAVCLYAVSGQEATTAMPEGESVCLSKGCHGDRI